MKFAIETSVRLVPKHDPILHETMPEYRGDPLALRPLAIAMFQVMHKIRGRQYGVGLAANQVGKRERLFIVNTASFVYQRFQDTYVCINPQVLERHGPPISAMEGCLSSPGATAITVRHEHIHARWTDLRGKTHTRELFGLLARNYQHELDHLDGRTIHDRVPVTP